MVCDNKLSLEQVKPKYKKMLLDMIEHYIPQGKIILFGSRARGDAKGGSDIDLVIDVGHKIEDRSISLLRLAVEEDLNIPMKADIVDFYDLPDDFKQIVQKEGIVWRS